MEQVRQVSETKNQADARTADRTASQQTIW